MSDEARRIEDTEIVELYWQRDETAIAETDKKYGKYLFKIAFNILHDKYDCDECVNDTYMGTWNRIPPARPNLFQVFLSKITRNVSVDRFRRNTAAKRIPSELVVSLGELDECLDINSSVEEAVLISEVGRILNDYLRSLTPEEEYQFVCRYYYCDRIEDIAASLEKSKSKVRYTLAKIRDGLRKRLLSEGFEV